jgi:GxxExxY protein
MQRFSQNDDDPLTRQIIAAAIKVHRELGPGLLESAYEACLVIELRQQGFHVLPQLECPVIYCGQLVDCAYRIDLLVNNSVIIELKAVSELLPIHEAQLISYLKLKKIRVGLLINFHEILLKNGIRRFVV